MNGRPKGHVLYVQRNSLSKWDKRFIELAEHVATWSKGPRKQIGAVIARPDRSIASLGYNGPPRDFDDAAFLAMTREEQHKVVIHAEDNAFQQMAPDDEAYLCNAYNGFTLYVSPLFPCADCAQKIVDKGIERVVAYCGEISPDWRASAQKAEGIFVAAGVECLFVLG